MSLPESLERAATELAGMADQIRPANGDPHRLLEELGADGAGQLLAWVLTEESDAAEELVEAWGENDAGVQILLNVADESIGKAGRKVLRKARHKLRSQGIAVVESAPVPTKRASAVPQDRWQAAHVSTADFRGARMGYLVDSHPNGGARLFEIRFDEGRGILDFKIYNAGRSKVRGFLKSLTAGSGQRLFEVERDALRALVWRAGEAQSSSRPLPTAYVEWRSRIFSSEELEKQETPGDLVRTALGEADPAASLEVLAEEIRSGTLGPWPPPTAWVGERMETARETVEGLDGEARAVCIETWIDEVTVSLEESTNGALISRHLDELAWVRWQSEQEDDARRLLSVSTAIGKDSAASTALTRARVESLFAPFLTELRVVEVPALDALEEAPGKSD
jgi:hypothetical protein